MSVLLIGYGNPGRGDDGLGPAIADAVENLHIEGVTVDSDYQLNIEYAKDISEVDVVVFVDASVEGEDPFDFRKIEPSLKVAFTTHSMNAESVLALCDKLYGKTPDAYLMAVRGHSFEMVEGLSDKGKENMGKAMEHLVSFLKGLQDNSR